MPLPSWVPDVKIPPHAFLRDGVHRRLSCAPQSQLQASKMSPSSTRTSQQIGFVDRSREDNREVVLMTQEVLIA